MHVLFFSLLPRKKREISLNAKLKIFITFSIGEIGQLLYYHLSYLSLFSYRELEKGKNGNTWKIVIHSFEHIFLEVYLEIYKESKTFKEKKVVDDFGRFTA